MTISKVAYAPKNPNMNFSKLVTLATFFRICNMPQGNSNCFKSKTKTQNVKCRVCLAVCQAHNYQLKISLLTKMHLSTTLW